MSQWTAVRAFFREKKGQQLLKYLKVSSALGNRESKWEAMAEAMRGALFLTLPGFVYAPHDTGDF